MCREFRIVFENSSSLANYYQSFCNSTSSNVILWIYFINIFIFVDFVEYVKALSRIKYLSESVWILFFNLGSTYLSCHSNTIWNNFSFKQHPTSILWLSQAIKTVSANVHTAFVPLDWPVESSTIFVAEKNVWRSAFRYSVDPFSRFFLWMFSKKADWSIIYGLTFDFILRVLDTITPKKSYTLKKSTFPVFFVNKNQRAEIVNLLVTHMRIVVVLYPD